MAKKAESEKRPAALSSLARSLLREMARQPERLEYHTRLLGGEITDADIQRLDAAYEELATRGLAEKTESVVSYFGTPKPVFRVTERGRREAELGGGGEAA